MSKNQYYKALYNKSCKYCGRDFQGRKQQVICSKCEGTRKIVKEKKKLLYCPVCRKNITGYKIVQTLHKAKLFSRGMCKDCKEISRAKIVERMKSDENPAIKIHGRKPIWGRKRVRKKKPKKEKILKEKKTNSRRI